MNLLDLIRGFFRGAPPAPRPATRYTALAESLRRRAELLESAPPGSDWVTPWMDMFNRFSGDPINYFATYANRKWGRNFPIFQTEQELQILRAPSRVLCASNAYAIGMVNGLTSYMVGKGYDFKAELKDEKDHEHAPLADAVNAILEAFRARNQWHGGEQPPVEAEFFQRTLEDGEGLIAHWYDPDPRFKGGIVLRFVEPEQLTMPPGRSFEEWSFGVHTPRDDAQHVQGYYLYWGTNLAEGEYYAPHQITHYRRNSKRTIKRGLPDFCFGTANALNTADRLRRNMGSGAAVQSAIAGVRQHEGATPGNMADMTNLLAAYQKSNQATGQSENVEDFPDGSILDVNQFTKWIDGPSAGNNQAYVSVLAACLAGATSRWNAPAWLATSDASNMGAYTSSLVAESPFVRFVEREQPTYGQAFLRSHWLAIECYVKAHGGVLEVPRKGEDGSYTVERYTLAHIRKLIDISAEPPTVQTRNKAEEARTALDEIKAETLSVQQWCQSQGRDYEQTMANIAEHKAAHPPEPPPGMPGQPGAAPPGAPGEAPPPETAAPPEAAGAPMQGAGIGSPPTAGVAESLRENFSGIDANGHHWENGVQVAVGKQAAPHQVQAHELEPTHDVRPEELLSKARDLAAAVTAKGSQMLDALPGAKYMRQKAAQLREGLEQRYGRKQALMILAAGQILSWTSTVGSIAAGVPAVIPSAVMTAPLVALAELVRQLRKKTGRVAESLGGMTRAELLAEVKTLVESMRAGPLPAPSPAPADHTGPLDAAMYEQFRALFEAQL